MKIFLHSSMYIYSGPYGDGAWVPTNLRWGYFAEILQYLNVTTSARVKKSAGCRDFLLVFPNRCILKLPHSPIRTLPWWLMNPLSLGT